MEPEKTGRRPKQRREDCVQVTECSTWRDAQQLLWCIGSTHQEVLFRGQSDEEWPLESSFGRLVRTLAEQRRWDKDGLRAIEQQLESDLLGEFRRAYYRIAGASLLPDDDVAVLALAQHHGLPTRLLDWTRSPYIAAFFAFDGCRATVFPPGQRVAIWAFDWEIFEVLLYYSYRDAKDEQVVADKPKDLQDVLRAIQGSPWPRIDKVQISGHVDRRMVHQDAFFTRAVKVEDDIESYLRTKSRFAPRTVLTKIIVPGSEQASALKDLSLMAINPVSLMNDPDAAAATAFNAVVRFKPE